MVGQGVGNHDSGGLNTHQYVTLTGGAIFAVHTYVDTKKVAKSMDTTPPASN